MEQAGWAPRRVLALGDAAVRALVEAIPDAVVVADADGRVVLVNRQTEELFGYARGELLGQPLALFCPAEDARAGVPEALLERAAREGRAEAEGWRVRKDGTRFRARAVLSALRGDAARLRGFVQVTTDVTERHRADEERARLAAELEEALRGRDQVLAGLAHDVRQPLTALLLGVELVAAVAERGDLDRAVLARAAAVVRASGGRLARWMGELGDASLLRLGAELPLARGPVDLVAVARALASERQRLAPQHRVTVTADRAELVGLWDAGRIERVVDNLVANAIKYSPGGGDVTIDVAEEGGWAVLRVRDQGVGIPAVDLPRVFELFRRGSNAGGGTSGSGIGLAVVRAAVERHGGSVNIESTEGAGTTVTVRLPLEPAPPIVRGTPRPGVAPGAGESRRATDRAPGRRGGAGARATGRPADAHADRLRGRRAPAAGTARPTPGRSAGTGTDGQGAPPEGGGEA